MTSIVEMPYASVIKPLSIQANGFLKHVVLRPAPAHLKSMNNWVVDQTLGLVALEMDDQRQMVRWTFASDADAALFKLRWS